MDSPYAQMDHDCLVLPVLRHPPRRALGVCRPRLGWLLGVGPGGKRVAAAVAERHSLLALRDDAGKTRHDASLERLAGFHHVYAVYSRDDADALRRRKFATPFRP